MKDKKGKRKQKWETEKKELEIYRERVMTDDRQNDRKRTKERMSKYEKKKMRLQDSKEMRKKEWER